MNHRRSANTALALTCQMMRGALAAVYLEDSATAETTQVVWPEGDSPNQTVVEAARQAKTSGQLTVQRLDRGEKNPVAVDFLLAKPVNLDGDRTASIAVLVKMNPQQQEVAIQLLDWGVQWMSLVLTDHQAAQTQPEQTNAWSAIKTASAGLFQSRRLLLGLVAGLIIALSVIVEGTYRINAPALLEGEQQRAVVAPFDGYVATEHKQAGDQVSAGDVLAEMDDQALNLSRQQFESERNEYDRQYRQALGRRDMAQASIYKSQIKQADAQLNLVRNQIVQAEITAPLDGVIIAGDLSQSLGAPVRLGDLLFEISPLDAYRLIIHVDEKDITQVKPGAPGEVSFSSAPSEQLAFTVHKVSPVHQEQLDSIAYRVEADLDRPLPSLRPGMQGVAKIEAGQRSYAWIYLHDVYNAIALWLWKWLP